MSQNWTEQDIAAFVDGVVADPAEAERLRHIIDRDAAAQAVAARIEASNRLLRAAFDAPMQAPAPAAMRASIDIPSAQVTTLPTRRRISGWAPNLMAAGLALAFGIGIGAHFFPATVPPTPARLGLASAAGPISHALERLASGEVSADGVRPMWTFKDANGRPCREFELIHDLPSALEVGVACRDAEGGWATAILVVRPSSTPAVEDYTPASGASDGAVGVLLDAVGAGVALSPHEERSLLDSGWRR